MGGVFYDPIQDIFKIFYWVGYDPTYRWDKYSYWVGYFNLVGYYLTPPIGGVLKNYPTYGWGNCYLPHLWVGYFMTPSKTFTKYFIGWGMTPHIGGVLKITPHMGGVISIYPIMGGVFYDTIQDICKIFYWVGYDPTYRWGIKKLPHLWVG